MSFMYRITQPSMEGKFEKQIDLAEKRVDSAKHLKLEEALNVLQSADVLIPFPKMQYEPTLWGKICTKINQFFTGTRFTSCKLVGTSGKEIIGYGAQAGTMDINICESRRFLNEHVDTIILRHNGNLTDKQKSDIVASMKKWSKVKPPYNYLATIKGWLAHIFGEVYYKIKNGDKEFLDHAACAMVCSSVVYQSFISNGVQIEHRNGIRGEYIFPLDFLCSKSFDVVGGFFSGDFDKHAIIFK